jgi:dolichyl-phosphate beta-glucosyltransferase
VLEIVVPAFNEELRLGPTLRALRTFMTSGSTLLLGRRVAVVVVDNASTDRTAELALAHSTPELPVRVVRCEVRGKGAATRAGVAATTAEFVAFMDADGATDLAALDEGVRLLLIGADVAIGSRAVGGAEVSDRHHPLRVHGAAAFRALAARVVPGIADTQCGLKVLHGDLARRLFSQLTIEGFTFDVELLALAQRHSLRIAEFPVRWFDVPGSTFQPARHGMTSFVDLARVHRRMRSVQPVHTPVTRLPRQLPAIITPETPLAVGLAADAR